MKNIEDIEKISLEQLEQIASAEGIKAPEHLAQKLAGSLEAAQAVSSLRRDIRRRNARIGAIWSSVALAAACLTLILTVWRGPKDTYTDPAVARAELEKTLAYISGKMERGIEMASEAENIIETTNKYFK